LLELLAIRAIQIFAGAERFFSSCATDSRPSGFGRSFLLSYRSSGASAEYRHFSQCLEITLDEDDLATSKQESSLHQSMENLGGHCITQRDMMAFATLHFPTGLVRQDQQLSPPWHEFFLVHSFFLLSVGTFVEVYRATVQVNELAICESWQTFRCLTSVLMHLSPEFR
jgi:hypothetical protein